MCNQNEIRQGAYRVAKMMGWINPKERTQIFTSEEFLSNNDSGLDKGLVICCRN